MLFSGIFLSCICKRNKKVAKLSFAVLDTNTQYDWQYAGLHKFTKIGSGELLQFYLDAKDGKVFIMILTQNGYVVCHSHPYAPDQNVIVNRNGCLKSAKSGEVWIDTDEINHGCF